MEPVIGDPIWAPPGFAAAGDELRWAGGGDDATLSPKVFILSRLNVKSELHVGLCKSFVDVSKRV